MKPVVINGMVLVHWPFGGHVWLRPVTQKEADALGIKRVKKHKKARRLY